MQARVASVTVDEISDIERHDCPRGEFIVFVYLNFDRDTRLALRNGIAQDLCRSDDR